MASTKAVTVTDTWTKLSDGNCTVQAESRADFDVHIGESAPGVDSAKVRLSLDEPATFSYGTAVYARLSKVSVASGLSVNVQSTVINVIEG